MKKVYPIIFSLLFWGLLIVPVLRPGVAVSSFAQTFFGHDKLIEIYNNLRLALGDRVFPNVIVGNNGWMFYSGDRSIDEYQNSNPYSETELADLQSRLDNLQGQFQQDGITLWVVIAPDKSSIYPEYMPDQITEISGKSRLDQFVAYMHDHGKTPVIDLRSALIEASKTEQVYYKTNTHWNALGVYIAYRIILSSLIQTYPGLVAHPLSDFTEIHAGLITHDIPRIIGTPNIKEDYWELRPTFTPGTTENEIPLSDGTVVRISRNQDQNLPVTLIFHDSFLVSVLPFLEPSFGYTVSIPRTSIPGIWNLDWVDQVQPSIVIYEFAERFLNYEILDFK